MTVTTQCEGTRRRVHDESPYRCPIILRTPGKTLCGRCEMAVEELGVEARWSEPDSGSQDGAR